MTEAPRTPAEPKPAASVLLVRDAPAGAREPLEVYMIRRNRGMKFLGGYYAFPGGKVDPVDGSINVQFYDRRDDPQNRKTRVTIARSTDGGKTFKNYAWTDEPFTGQNAFLGDYEWLAAYGGKVYGIWAEAAPEAIR